MKPIILKNDALQMEFSPETGALTGFRVSETNWSVLDRPQLGLSFKLLVPSGRRRNNPVDGEKQKLTQSAVAPDGRSVRFVWDGVTSLHAGKLDIRVELDIRLEARKAVWTMNLVNRTKLVIEAAYVPYLGDLRQPADAEWLRLMHASYSGPAIVDLWPTFRNQHGYFGVDHPIAMPTGNQPGTPMIPFYLVHSQNQGLYVGIDEPTWEFSNWHSELLPGYDRSIDQRKPAADHISQHTVHVRSGIIHLPYVQPGETRRLTPISIEPYRGDWHAGADIYRRSTVKPVDAKLPGWLTKPHSWLQIHVNSPEGEGRIRYVDLVPLASEMARHGITGMQITGWNLGGQDQDNPCHDTDPLLGTWEELRDSIAAIKKLGVKVILFTKYTWADRGTKAFRDTYRSMAVKDPYGDYYMHPGYKYQTPMQLMDISTKRLIPMCFLNEEYLKVCEREFQKVLDLKADGFLFDECLHHGPARMCFSTEHGHRIGAPIYANDNHLIERFEKMSKPVNPDFCYAGEALYDWEFAKYHFSYFRTESTNHVPWFRYIRPHAPISTAVTGFDDREMIAQCLLYNYIISYEPFNFKGRPEDYPLTIEYGKKMDALRTELRRWFWDGECRDTLEAKVTNAEGKPHHPYAVFVPRGGGAPGVAIANYSPDKEAVLSLKIDGQDAAKYKYRLIDDPTWKSAAEGVHIPARGAVVAIPGAAVP